MQLEDQLISTSAQQGINLYSCPGGKLLQPKWLCVVHPSALSTILNQRILFLSNETVHCMLSARQLPAEGRTSNLQLCVQCDEQRNQNSLSTVCFWTSVSLTHPHVHINGCVLDFGFLSAVITSCPPAPQIFLQVKLTHCQD